MKMGISCKLLIALISLAVFLQHVQAQNCTCSSDECCNSNGDCGTGESFCGAGCLSGPCDTTNNTLSTTTLSTDDTSTVSNIVTDNFFNGIIGQAAANCAGKSFYTRQAFLDAVSGYSAFANDDGSTVANKREIAAFFGHVTHETGHFCYIEEINKATYCDTDPRYAQYPCNPKKQYYGRGPLQLTWNYNYGAAGIALGFDGLNSPETVATSVTTSFKSALWYWMQSVHPVIGQGFGATINAINGALECNGGPGASAVQSRITYYKDYCTQFGVSPGDKLTC